MRALSIRQPWAWAILHAGKDIENRDWSKRYSGYSRRHPFPAGLTLPSFASLPRGGIVGKAELHDVVSGHPSPWFFGPVGLVIRNARPLPFVPLKGALGFFNVPDDLVREVA